MASDPSIYNQLGANVVQPVNPLALQAQSANTANALMGVRAQVARQAAGQAFQQSINPDGTTNQSALMQNLAANPQAAMAAQESAQQGQTLSAAEYQQHMQRLNYGASGAAQLLTLPGGPTMDAVKGYYDKAVQDGHVTAADEGAVMQGFGADPASNAAIIKQRLMQNVGAQQALTAALPNYTPTNTGGTTFFRDANPITNPNGMGSTGTGFTNTPGPQFIGVGGANVPTTGGAPLPGAPSIPNTLSPSEATAPTQIGVDASGAPIMGTRQQFIGRATGQSPLGTGRLPAALQNPNKPQVPATADTNAQPPRSDGVVTGIGPAQQSAMATQGTDSAKAFQDIADQGVQARSQNATLGNMLGDAAQFTSGMTKANDFKTFLTRQLGPIAQSFGISPDKVAANESFDKLANQIVGQQGSDARLAVAQHGNPSSNLSPQGVDQILRQLQGNADYNQVRAKLAAQYPNQSDRAGFETNVGTTLDPRAFQFDRMTPDQQKTYATSLSPTDRAAVHTAYLSAAKQGLLSSGYRTPPPAAQPSATPRGY